MRPGQDGSERLTGSPGDGFERQIAVIPHEQDLPVRVRQSRQGLLNVTGPFAAKRVGVGRGVRRRDHPRQGLVAIVAERDAPFARSPTDPVARQVHRNAKDPRPESAFRTVRSPASEGTEQRFLHQVFGHVGPADHAKQEAVNARREGYEQALDVPRIACAFGHAFRQSKRASHAVIAANWRVGLPVPRWPQSRAGRRLTRRQPPGYHPAMRTLGLDLGRRRVGVAVSDPDGTIAHPLLQFEPKGRGDLVARVKRLVAEHETERVVVGMPVLEDGGKGQQARWTEAVVSALAEALEVPVATWDERFTTQDAEAAMREAGLHHRKRKARRDKVAAALILQSYLDAESRR